MTRSPVPPNNSGNRERTPLSTRSPRLARLTKSKLPPPKSKSIPHPAFEFKNAYLARSPWEPLSTSPCTLGLANASRTSRSQGSPHLRGPVAPERGFKFRVEVSNDLRRPAGQSPVNMNRPPGRFVVIFRKGASEFEPDRFVVRRDDHEFIFSRVVINLRLPEQKGHGNDHAEQKENRNDATHPYSPRMVISSGSMHKKYSCAGSEPVRPRIELRDLKKIFVASKEVLSDLPEVSRLDQPRLPELTRRLTFRNPDRFRAQTKGDRRSGAWDGIPRRSDKEAATAKVDLQQFVSGPNVTC